MFIILSKHYQHDWYTTALGSHGLVYALFTLLGVTNNGEKTLPTRLIHYLYQSINSVKQKY